MEEEHVLRDILYQAIGSIDVQENVRMSGLTTFHIGGPADIVVAPEDERELSGALSALSTAGVRYFVLGRGSNLLVSDEGYRGAVIRMDPYFQRAQAQGNIVIAQSGLTLTSLSSFCLKHGLSGMEFACGIPGTVGGAVYMNAGAYGGEMKDVVQEVTVMDLSGKVMHLDRQDLAFGKRSSILQQKPWIATEVVLQLTEGDPEKIKTRMEEITRERREKQPLDLPSAGSVFKRPEGYYAGALIEQAGLKGYQIGGARVSEKHAGFIVNAGGATCRDVLELIRYIRKTVMDKFQVRLEAEIRYLGPEGLEAVR